MANIQINEISQNYMYNIGTSNYATVALPITACWGPGYEDEEASGLTTEELLETVKWKSFPATQAGLDAFNTTYKGAMSGYRMLDNYSFQMAMTLLTHGYNVLTCRLACGAKAQGTFYLDTKEVTEEVEGEGTVTTTVPDTDGMKVVIKAKYVGSFGNKLRIVLRKVSVLNRWNLIVYVVDDTGVQTAVENRTFVFDMENASDIVLHVDEVESDYVTILADYGISDSAPFTDEAIRLEGGSDSLDLSDMTAKEVIEKAVKQYTIPRFEASGVEPTSIKDVEYVSTLNALAAGDLGEVDANQARVYYTNEWIYTHAYNIYDMISDKLAYAPNRIISPGWDDQNVNALTGSTQKIRLDVISPLHEKLMDVAYKSRCATAYIDVPRSLGREYVYNDSDNDSEVGYVQMLARSQNDTVSADGNIGYFATNSAFFAPWGHYVYASTSKQALASPSFIALVIERSMILNQPSQYEWELPQTRRHNLKIGKLDYTISKKYLDMWQTLEGVGVNCITDIPGMGVSIWGNSTLYEVPPATYQALANLSTRKLVNAVEDLAYKCGISITFQYNNQGAFQSFYAGMSPLLDTMKNVGAIDDYYIRMSQDIDALGTVNSNSVIGAIYLTVRGVVNDINIDLIALPDTADLNEYRA